MAKVTYLIPPAEKGKNPERTYGCSYTIYPTPNLAILYSAAVLRKEHDVRYVNYSSKSWQDFERKLRNDDSDFFIFHTVLLSTKPDTRASDLVLKRTKARVIYFGPHPTYTPEKFLTDERVAIARGEAEFVIENLVNGWERRSKILGVSYRSGAEVHHNGTAGIIEDIDILPFPARDLDTASYINPKLSNKRFTNILTSRGCSYRCYFCVPMAISWARELEWKKYNKGKPPVTTRSPENVIAELKSLSAEGLTEISFIDDMFMWGDDRIIKICKGMKGLGFTFGLLARADHLQGEEVVKALAEAGCKYIDIGVESFDQTALNYARKGLKAETAEKAIMLLNKYGIEPKVNIIFGMSPTETKESMEETLKKTKQLPINYAMFSICTPFPGTDFEAAAKENKWQIISGEEVYENLDPAKRSLIQLPKISAKELERMAKKANREFYLRPSMMKRQLAKVRDAKSLVQNIKSGIRLIK